MRSIFGLIAERLFPSRRAPPEDSAPLAVALWEGGDRLGAFADDLPDTGIHAGSESPDRDDFS